jgi:hypothetical protein
VFWTSASWLVSDHQQSGIGREVALPTHLQHGQELAVPLPALLAHGLLLFNANWTEQEGGGRPWTKGTGRPLDKRLRRDIQFICRRSHCGFGRDRALHGAVRSGARGTIAGWRADKPITPKVVWDACQSAATRAKIEKRVSATSGDIRTPRICWRPVRTSAPANCCSAT